MNELKVFANAQFGQVRVIDENGKPLVKKIYYQG